MHNLEGKTAIISGAASGIGEATARLFIKEGARVLLSDIKDEKGTKIAEELGSDALFMHVDVSNESDIEKAVDSVVEKWGKLDIIFNNAGYSGVQGSIDVLPGKGIDDSINVIFKGVLFGVKHASRVMKNQGFGSIINNASVSGMVAGPSGHLYSSCKAAVIHLTRVVASELGEFNVRVNCVSPGAIVTDIWFRSGDVVEEKKDRIGEVFSGYSPLRRSGYPVDVAKAVLWLGSDESGFVTGHNLVVDGGLSLGFTRDTIKQFAQKVGKALS